MTIDPTTLRERLAQALAGRADLIDPAALQALRLFNGFYEGCPALVADLYGNTLALFDHHDTPEVGAFHLRIAQDFLLAALPWIECVVQKQRQSGDPQARRGRVTLGDSPAQAIREHGVSYAIDLLMNQDASFYLDTRGLRRWLLDHAAGWQVLNTFAYTGSLGVAALAGGAAGLIQVDRNARFLALARRSGSLNRLDIGKMKLRAADFFSEMTHLKRSNTLFDCVILDPPYFSTTTKGTVDLVNESARLINKVRPLIKDGGWLVAINNALFLSGAEYLRGLERLCVDGYLSLESLIPVPSDVTGLLETRHASPPADPDPFNHPTKIAILRVKRKLPAGEGAPNSGLTQAKPSV